MQPHGSPRSGVEPSLPLPPFLQAMTRRLLVEEARRALGHDLRNHLAGARNAVFVMRTRLPGGEQDPASPASLARLIDRELGAATAALRVAEGSPVAAEGVDLRGALARLLGELSPPPRVAIDLHGEDARQAVALPADDLALLVFCLLENAVEAVAPGGRVTVRVSAAGDQAEVEVCDDGPGVAEEHRPRVFEPFFSTRPGHVGLGLCLARRLALRWGGELELRAGGEDPAGARFAASLPLAPEGGRS